MRPWRLDDSRTPSLLVLSAHPDDAEIGCGGTLLALADRFPGLRAHALVCSASPERRREAEQSARRFLPGAHVSVQVLDVPDGRFPAEWNRVKQALEDARHFPADLIFAPNQQDAHQDHRLLAELVPTVWRDHLVLSYEIPKWDGDLGRPHTYVPLTRALLERKLALLHECFPSQTTRDWWDDEVFRGLARLRGMECRAPYAEGFHVDKAVLELG